MVIVTREAINDIGTFYGNTMIQYPNTWDEAMVQYYINETIDSIEQTIITTLSGTRKPLLQTLQDGSQVGELFTQKGNKRLWYFSVRIVGENVYVENAWYYTNASNRAFRRGQQTPNTNLSLDDRNNQERLKEQIISRIITETINTFLRRECI